ncbi:hypothetical protein P4475_04070 [Halalkalibacterium halodurans]|jgi:hypothetical protein|uniref:hypothetical protein n=1 Tax=Halalkalibacterium halodurans TaxID=86665 RepID=UPI002E224834|nr:hypothetical protein [Halalkalibacterium halodurans]
MRQLEIIQRWIDENQLVVISLLEGDRKVIGRILHYDSKNRACLVYEDDGKSVHHLALTEIQSIKRTDGMKKGG